MSTSETSDLRGTAAFVKAQNKNGRSSRISPEGPSEHLEEAALPAWMTAYLDEDSEQSVPPRGLLNPAPDITHPRRKMKRRGVFGLTHETGLNNRDAYDQKYARDEYGEETSENARIWLTYLDEAEPFDRERVEEWKGAADVLLVFAGLFSSVITTFIVQALQGLQQDNTQVSASLLFEIAGILRAQSNGTPLNMVPNSPLTPTSPFTPSTNALLVNGLWFTSLAITLSIALFAVIAKQWPRYSLASIPGTPNERARARQLRFKGFEVWKVGAILDLLPILLYLAVGLFLTGIIIMLFPLNAAIAWTIVGITGITYTLYFISVILPIRYPECPYTTSMTIYVGVLFFALRNILSRGLRVVWRTINPRASVTRRLRSNVTGFTKWREQKIKQAVETATSLDFEALSWLYGISWNRSVHRMIARCAAVNPTISKGFGSDILENLNRSLEISEGNVVDLRYGLCLDLLTFQHDHWDILQSIPNAEGSKLKEEEYQTYLRIADTVLGKKYTQTLHNAIDCGYGLPLAMWDYLFKEASTDATVAARILTRGTGGLFDWAFNPTRELIPEAGLLVCFDYTELGWWKFEHLYRHFRLGKPDYSSQAKTYETCHLLLIAIYHNLDSRNSIITSKKQRQESLEQVFRSFIFRVTSDDLSYRLQTSDRPGPSEDVLPFFTKMIYSVNSFWRETVTDDARRDTLVSSDLSRIYRWYSRDHDLSLSSKTPPLFVALLVSQNRHHLSTILLDDPNAVSNFSKCVYNLAIRQVEQNTRIHPILMDLLKSAGPKKNPLFTIIYDPSVLLQLWSLLVVHGCDTQEYFQLLMKSEIEKNKLDELFAAMNVLAQTDNRAGVRPALATSARQFGQLIRVSQPPGATFDQSAPGNAPSNNDHDNEERAHWQVPGPDERRTFNFTGNGKKKVFESMW